MLSTQPSLGPKKVIAIEPNPKILERLNDNIALNNLSSNIAVHNVAVGDKKGVVKLVSQIVIL